MFFHSPACLTDQQKIDINLGKPHIAYAAAVINSIEIGVRLVTSGKASALTTNPIQKRFYIKRDLNIPVTQNF